MSKDYPECSGDPACCPENEGHGCCHLSRKPEKPAVVTEVLTANELINKLVEALKRLAHAGQMLNQGKPVRDLDEVYGEVNEAIALADKWRKG